MGNYKSSVARVRSQLATIFCRQISQRILLATLDSSGNNCLVGRLDLGKHSAGRTALESTFANYTRCCGCGCGHFADRPHLSPLPLRNYHRSHRQLCHRQTNQPQNPGLDACNLGSFLPSNSVAD